MVVLISTTNGNLPCPSSIVIFPPNDCRICDTIRYRLLCKVLWGCSESTYLTLKLIDDSATHFSQLKDKVVVSLLKVRFVDCLLGIPKSIATLVCSRSISHLSGIFKEVPQRERRIFKLDVMY